MHVSSFYSFKGGVGRTLALVNVASYLALSGRKVLMVDFDLEAPGISTFDICADARGRSGLLEFVNTYLRTSNAPSVEDYLHKCSLTCQGEIFGINRISVDRPGELWVMPAGNIEAGYGSEFRQINWRDLYDKQDGYILMQDLKAQWERQGFDYVLIDSRTGLTDISGICTRQLPHLVVALFFPNEQNLVGLREVVQDIREENKRRDEIKKRFRTADGSIGAQDRIAINFVASRIPNLDDEKFILRSMIQEFSAALKVPTDSILKIHDYHSLNLLKQEIFICTRERSSLADEYRELVRSLLKQNVNDPEGAHLFLLEQISEAQASFGLSSDSTKELTTEREINEKIQIIEDRHKNEPVVMDRLAHYHLFSGGSPLHAWELSKLAVSHIDCPKARATKPEFLTLIHTGHVRISEIVGKLKEAEDSIEYCIGAKDIGNRRLLQILRLVVRARDISVPSSARIQLLKDLNGDERFEFAENISDHYSPGRSRQPRPWKAWKLAADIIEETIDKRYPIDPAKHFIGLDLLLLVATHRFRPAIALVDDVLKWNIFECDVTCRFNYAIARWALDSQPSKDLFATIAKDKVLQDESDLSANRFQCLALSWGVLEDNGKMEIFANKAIQAIKTEPKRREFSCWRFKELSQSRFVKDCNEMKNYFLHGEGQPDFLPQNHTLPLLH